MFEALAIDSPKQTSRSNSEWNGFFPYYAGFPASFALHLLESARLQKNSVILDPWNGSGTTTYVASRMGLRSRGTDLNPAMIIVARARSLPASEADSLDPLAKKLIAAARADVDQTSLSDDDPLLSWFAQSMATYVRSIERSIRRHLVGELTLTPAGTSLECISGIASTFYVALFSLCRRLVAPYKGSNPTWLRLPKDDERKLSASFDDLSSAFLANVRAMSDALGMKAVLPFRDFVAPDLLLADTASTELSPNSIDFVLTSPPYCTRIDYTAATRIELAIVSPLVGTNFEELGRQMTGSTRVPRVEVAVSNAWGAKCKSFLKELRTHSSKASAGYYYKTHLDYFDKLSRSIANTSAAMRPSARAVLVVQDSYYKEVHNDLPSIVSEICCNHGLQLRRRVDFSINRSMSGINPRSKTYNSKSGRVEAVLCFDKR